ARYLTHLKRPQEALYHIKWAIHVSNYPRAMEEAQSNGSPFTEDVMNVDQLRKLSAEIQKQVAHAKGNSPSTSLSDELALFESCSLDSDSYDSDKDDSGEEGFLMSK